MSSHLPELTANPEIMLSTIVTAYSVVTGRGLLTCAASLLCWNVSVWEDSVTEGERQRGGCYTLFYSRLCWSVMSCTYIPVTPFSPCSFCLIFFSSFLFFCACVNRNNGNFHQAQQHESPLDPVTLCWVSALVHSNRGVSSLSSNHSRLACTADAGRGIVRTDVDVLVTLLIRCSTWTGWSKETERRQGFLSFSRHKV